MRLYEWEPKRGGQVTEAGIAASRSVAAIAPQAHTCRWMTRDSFSSGDQKASQFIAPGPSLGKRSAYAGMSTGWGASGRL